VHLEHLRDLKYVFGVAEKAIAWIFRPCRLYELVSRRLLCRGPCCIIIIIVYHTSYQCTWSWRNFQFTAYFIDTVLLKLLKITSTLLRIWIQTFKYHPTFHATEHTASWPIDMVWPTMYLVIPIFLSCSATICQYLKMTQFNAHGFQIPKPWATFPKSETFLISEASSFRIRKRFLYCKWPGL
jgi:hypothetical protein